MTLARVAAQLDPATELDEFQQAARVLITHGLVTAHHPYAGALALIRQFEEPLRAEFARMCRWGLDVSPTCARLRRRPAGLSTHRPARTATQRAFSPQAYASLCLLLAAIEGLGVQTSISQLAREVSRLRAGDETIPFDLTSHAHRRAFVDAAAWLEERGVLVLLDGDTEKFVAGDDGDALYDIDRDAAGRLLASPPSVLSGLTAPEDFLDEPYPPTIEGEQMRARHRVHRRLLSEPVLSYDELPDAERDYARQRRTRIGEELERLTGCTVECRLEGQAVIGLPAAEPFPGGGAVAQAALLFGGELALAAAGEGHIRTVERDATDAAWRRVAAAYQGRFTADYRAQPERLRAEAMALLQRLSLVAVDDAENVTVTAALSRYRASVRLPETLGV